MERAFTGVDEIVRLICSPARQGLQTGMSTSGKAFREVLSPYNPHAGQMFFGQALQPSQVVLTPETWTGTDRRSVRKSWAFS